MGPGDTADGTFPAAPTRPRCPRCGTRVVTHGEAAPSSQRDVPPPAPLTSAPLRTAAASRHRRSRCRFHNGSGELKRAPGSGERGGVAQRPGPLRPPNPPPAVPKCSERVEREKRGGWKIPRDPRRAPPRGHPQSPPPPRPPGRSPRAAPTGNGGAGGGSGRGHGHGWRRGAVRVAASALIAARGLRGRGCGAAARGRAVGAALRARRERGAGVGRAPRAVGARSAAAAARRGRGWGRGRAGAALREPPVRQLRHRAAPRAARRAAARGAAGRADRLRDGRGARGERRGAGGHRDTWSRGRGEVGTRGHEDTWKCGLVDTRTGERGAAGTPRHLSSDRIPSGVHAARCQRRRAWAGLTAGAHSPTSLWQRGPSCGDSNGTLTSPPVVPPVPQVSWLDSSQTAQKEKPFLYTSGFPVLNRSFFPGFHTPAMKSTYTAQLQVTPLTALSCLSPGVLAQPRADRGEAEALYVHSRPGRPE